MENNFTAIFAALSHEIALIKGRMEIDKRIRRNHTTIFSGRIKNRPLLLVQTGIGRDAMFEAVENVLEDYSLTQAINIGYCGGASPELFVGDIIIPENVIEENGKKSYQPDKELAKKAITVCKNAGIESKHAKLLTCDKAVLSPHDKAFIGTRFNAHAIDMESSAFLKATSAKKIPALVVRSVLDPLDTHVPTLDNSIEETGDVNVAGLVGEIVSKPKLLFKLPKFNYLSTKARESLTTFIDKWLVATTAHKD